MSDDPRIEQFKQMVQADPDNELGHFSLGKANLDAGNFADAAGCLAHTVELNPRMSKAHQLLGEAYDKAGQRAEAIDAVTRGVTVADEQGDRMPRDAMIAMLRQWDAEVPTLREEPPKQSTAPNTEGLASGFQCSRCGRPAGQLPKPPFKGELGQRIFAKACETCWREWIPTGTKVINELGLTLSSPEGQRAYDEYMLDFLQLHDA